MKLAYLLTTSIIPIISAWHLQLYRDASYINIIEDRSGSLGQPCKNLPAANRDKVSSMHWDSNILCTIVLYNYLDCYAELGRSTGSWHLPNFSPNANDKVDSYRIIC